MNACLEMDGLIAEGASGDLAPEDRARLDAHLRSCARCRAELARYEEVFDLARSFPSPSPREVTPGRARRGQERGEETATAPQARLTGAGSTVPDLSRSALAAWKRHRRRRAVALALGAGLLPIAAAAALVLAPGLLARRGLEPTHAGSPAAAWEPDVDGLVAASTVDLEQDEDLTTEDVALAALDAAQVP